MNIEEARKNLKVGDRSCAWTAAMTKGGFAVAYAGAVTYRARLWARGYSGFEVCVSVPGVRPSSIIKWHPTGQKTGCCLTWRVQ